MLKQLLVVFAGLLSISACQAQDGAAAKTNWEAGKNYFVIDPPRPMEAGKVEVVEVFSYACPHCAHFQPYADEIRAKLPKQVQFRYVPAVFRPQWEPYARAYYSAQSLGVFDRTHQALFDALHRDNKPYATLPQLAEFYAGNGVDPNAFMSTAQSFIVAGNLARDQELVRAWGIDATPTIVVNGKYRFTAEAAGGFPQSIELTKFLVDKELAAKPAGK